MQDGWKEGQYWDTAKPFHYVRAVKHDDKGLVLLVGGEDHNTGIKPKEYEVGSAVPAPPEVLVCTGLLPLMLLLSAVQSARLSVQDKYSILEAWARSRWSSVGERVFQWSREVCPQFAVTTLRAA